MLSSSWPEHAITGVQNRGIPDGLVYARDLRGFRRLLLLAWQGNRKTDSVGAPALRGEDGRLDSGAAAA